MKSDVLEKQKKIAFLFLLWRIPNAVTSFTAAVASKSLVVWMEFIEDVSILIPGIILVILSKKLSKNLKFKFNYGTGKVEAITALCCEMFDLAGLGCILFFAIRSLIKPHEEQSDMLVALIVSLVGIVIDIIILRKEKAITEAEHSRMLHTAYLGAQKEFGFELISITTIVISMIFSKAKWIHYFSPVLGIILTIPFGFFVIHHLRGAVLELSDITLDEESQLKILKVINEFDDSYEYLGNVKSRINGKYKHIDIEMQFKPTMTYAEARDVSGKIKKRIVDEIGECSVNILI